MKTTSIRGRLLASTLFASAAALGAAAVVMVPTLAAAQDYTSGNLNGRVETDAGAPVAGATVTLRSGQGQVRTATTDANGAFRIPALPAGAYTADVSANGLNSLTGQRVAVQPGGSSFTFTLSSGTVSEVVITAAARATPDFNRTDTGLTVDVQDLANRVPVGRSISSVALLTPGVGVTDPSIIANGVRRNQQTVTVAGTSAAESVYYVNGLNVTDQRTFLGYADLPFDAIQTVDVKTGGYQAEFGRGTGGVINIVTRSGSNDFHFGASAYWTPNFLREDRGMAYGPGGQSNVGQQILNQFSKVNQNEQTIWASGPIIKDHVFFFGLYNPRFSDTWFAPTFSNPTTANGTQVREKYNDHRWMGKFDFVLNPQHRLEVTLFSDETTTDSFQYNFRRATQAIGSDPTNPAVSNPDGSLLSYASKSGGFNQIYHYQGVFTDWFTLSALYGKINSSYQDYGDYIGQPGVQDLAVVGGYVTVGRIDGPFDLIGEDVRETYRLDADFYFRLLGEHHLRVGYDQEKLNSTAGTKYTGGGAYIAYAQEDCPEGAGPAGCILIERFSNTGSFEAEQSAYYVQDSWEVTPNLTLQLGLRADIYDYKNVNGQSYISIDNQLAPRLGFIWDPRGEGVDRLYGSAGDYYLPIATNTSIRASSGEVYTDTFYQAQRDANGRLVFNGAFPVIGAQIGGVNYLSPPGAPDVRAVAVEDLKPMYEREFILGYEHTFGDTMFGGRLNGWKAGVRYIHRNLERAIEDTAIGDAVVRYCQRKGIYNTVCNPDPDVSAADFSSVFPFSLINPGQGGRLLIDLQGDTRTDPAGNPNPAYNPQVVDLTAEDLALPEADRSYQALELTFERPFDGKWGVQGSYTLGKSHGNYEGAVKSDVGQIDTSLTQDFDHLANMRYAEGDLPNDRRHVFKIFGTYKPFDRLTIGANFTASSGRPYGCIGVTPQSVDPLAPDSGTPSSWYCPTGARIGTVTGNLLRQLQAVGGDTGIYEAAPSGRGTRHLEWQYQTDLTMAFDLLKAEEGKGHLEARLDVFNLFDNDAVTRVVEQGEVRTPAVSQGGVKGIRAPFYGLPRNYQAPRTVRFGLRYEF